MQLHGHARMARAILALKVIQLLVPEWLEPLCMALNWPCKNGSYYSAKASYYFRVPNGSSHSCTQVMPAMLEWLEPFRPSRNATGHARMAQAIIALKRSNWPCQNGTEILYLEVLEPFWHSNIYSNWPSQNGSSQLALKLCNWRCQNGSSRYRTQT